jgi:putative transposase
MIKLHMIFVVKYRKPLLTNGLDEDVKQIMFDISKLEDSLFTIDTQECDGDHIHMLLDIQPTVSPSAIASRLKQMSTHRMWEKHGGFLKTHFWKEHTLWSDGYFVCSTGDASMETIKKYIEEQG